MTQRAENGMPTAAALYEWEYAMDIEPNVTFKCEGCGARKPESERYRPRSAYTVCSQACLDKAAQQKARAMHDPRRRDLLGSD